MTESIRQFGEKLQKDIVSHNTDKQVMGFLSEAKTLNLDSPTFQGDLVGVLAKYPMAAGDQRALMGAKLLEGGWQQKQAQKAATEKFERDKTIAGIRSGSNRPYGGLVGGAGLGGNPMPPPTETSPLGSPQQGFEFGAGMGNVGPLGVPFQTSDDLPPLPDSGTPISQDAALFDKDVGQLAEFYRKQGIPEKLAKQKIAEVMADRVKQNARSNKPLVRQANGIIYERTTEGEWMPMNERDPNADKVYDSPDGVVQHLKDGKWKMPDGSVTDIAPKGIKQIPSATASEDLKLRQQAALRSERKSKLDEVKLSVTDLAQRRAQLMAARRGSLTAGDTPAAEAQWNEVQVLNKTIDDLKAGLSTEEAESIKEDRLSPEDAAQLPPGTPFIGLDGKPRIRK